MGDAGSRWDLARQAANVVGAVFQVTAPPVGALILGSDIGTVSSENGTLVVPADYAFVIWSPIFLLAFAYAVYQALPSRRTDPLMRTVGWFSAFAFFSNGLWSILFVSGRFLLAQVVFFGIFAGAVGAHLMVQRSARSATSSKEAAQRWLLTLAFGLLAGWVTAAFFVSFATTLVAVGLLGGGVGEAVVGSALLLLGGCVAAVVVWTGKDGPPQGYLAYAAAVLWALVGVVVNQYDASALTTGAATVAAVAVTLALLGALRGGRQRSRTSPAIRTGTA